jgi:hypothetical protein
MAITGIDCLTVPCETAKQGVNTLRPIYTGAGYVCVFCGGFFFRYKPCTWHMGMVMNIPCACQAADTWHRHVAFNHQLPCAFCSREFHDFGGLATHVQTEHADVVDMLHRIAENITEEEDERDDMLPQVGGGKRNDRQGQSGGGRRPAPAVPFLVVDDLKADPVRAKILGLETKNTGFNDVIVKIAIGGKSFFMGLKASNPNYEALTAGLGFDENKWVGQEFMIGLQWNEFYEKNFVQVYECPALPPPGERKSKVKD